MSPEPEPWQTNATAPFLTIERPLGTVTVWSLAKERFRVEAPGHDSEVNGYHAAGMLDAYMSRADTRVRLAQLDTTGPNTGPSSDPASKVGA